MRRRSYARPRWRTSPDRCDGVRRDGRDGRAGTERLLAAGRRASTASTAACRRWAWTGVLADLDRGGVPWRRRARPPARASPGTRAIQADPDWWPQGVAALRSGRSWSSAGRPAPRGLDPRVAHHGGGPVRPDRAALPARPAGRAAAAPLLRTRAVHAGGIAVLGDLLYVADTRAGVRVFRLQDVREVPRRRLDALLPVAVSRHPHPRTPADRRHTAYGFSHVLPQLLRLRLSPEPGGRPLRYSFVFVGPLDGPAEPGRGRVRPQGQHPAAGALRPRSRRPACPSPAARGGTSRWRCTRTPRCGCRASRCTTAPGTSAPARPGQPRGPARRTARALPPAPRGAAARAGGPRLGPSGHELWSLTEWPGHRVVFPVDPAGWPGPDSAA
jgi:hypothetical protein